MEIDPYFDISDQPTIFVIIIVITVLLLLFVLGWHFMDWYVNVASNHTAMVRIGR